MTCHQAPLIPQSLVLGKDPSILFPPLLFIRVIWVVQNQIQRLLIFQLILIYKCIFIVNRWILFRTTGMSRMEVSLPSSLSKYPLKTQLRIQISLSRVFGDLSFDTEKEGTLFSFDLPSVSKTNANCNLFIFLGFYLSISCAYCLEIWKATDTSLNIVVIY